MSKAYEITRETHDNKTDQKDTNNTEHTEKGKFQKVHEKQKNRITIKSVKR